MTRTLLARSLFVVALLSVALVHAGGSLPKLEESEKDQRIAPEHMICDTCAAAVFHINWKLLKATEKAIKAGKNQNLKESHVLEIVDDACMPRTYATTYGTKAVPTGRKDKKGVLIKGPDGEPESEHHLSGDGLKYFGHQSPTVGTLEPGMWLTDTCRRIQGEVEEDRLYSMFQEYHLRRKLPKQDVAMFRQVCINEIKMCTQEQGLYTYDTFEKEDLSVELATDI